jgi:ChpA-C
MKKVRWVSATAGAALVAAMFALPGAGVAHAPGNGNTTGNGNVSVLSGNTITAPVSVPVNLCGISLAVAGFSNANCKGGSTSCIGNDCHPCQGNCAPPHGCTTNCSPNTPPTGPPGNHPGGTTTTVSTGTSPSGLPTTGADLLLLGVAALGSIGVGAGAVAVARRRRNGEA